MKEYSTLLKSLELELRNQMQFSVIPKLLRFFFWGILILSRGYSMPHWQGGMMNEFITNIYKWHQIADSFLKKSFFFVYVWSEKLP